MLGLPAEFTPEFIARLEHLRLKTRREFAGMGKGSHLSPRRGSSLEFNDFRHYSRGDDFRFIDWGLYGRTDKYYIKLYKEEEDLLTYIFLDASASMGYPQRDRKFEAAVATTLAVAYVALASGDRVMLRVLAGKGDPPPPVFVYGRHRIVELGRHLGTIRPGGETRFRAGARARDGFDSARGKGLRDLGFSRAAQFGRARAGTVHGGQYGRERRANPWATELDGQGLQGDVEVVDAESGERAARFDRGAGARTLSRDADAPGARNQNILFAFGAPLRALHDR